MAYLYTFYLSHVRCVMKKVYIVSSVYFNLDRGEVDARIAIRELPHARSEVVDTLRVQRDRVQKWNACIKQLNGIECMCMCREQV